MRATWLNNVHVAQSFVIDMGKHTYVIPLWSMIIDGKAEVNIDVTQDLINEINDISGYANSTGYVTPDSRLGESS